MSNWTLKFAPEAGKDLEKLDNNLRRRIIGKLDWLQDNFDKISPSALGDEWRGFFKLKI